MAENATAPRRSPIGLASLVAGVLLLLWGLVASALRMAMPALLASVGSSYGIVSLLIMLPGLLLALVALGLGIGACSSGTVRGSRRSSAPRSAPPISSSQAAGPWPRPWPGCCSTERALSRGAGARPCVGWAGTFS